jgi:hypothetical protein
MAFHQSRPILRISTARPIPLLSLYAFTTWTGSTLSLPLPSPDIITRINDEMGGEFNRKELKILHNL